MKKADRQAVFEKYDGHCAYCGCELQKGWHVDHIEPIRRRTKRQESHYLNPNTKEKILWYDAYRMSEQDLVGYKWIEGKEVSNGCDHPERETIENYMPSCASCNINKHSMTLEQFRETILGYVNSLNLYSTQYKMAKKYGLVIEPIKTVEFYFETLEKQ